MNKMNKKMMSCSMHIRIEKDSLGSCFKSSTNLSETSDNDFESESDSFLSNGAEMKKNNKNLKMQKPSRVDIKSTMKKE